MDEETAIIDSNTRNERIKNFFVKNKTKLSVLFSLIAIILLSYFAMTELKQKKKIRISDDFNFYVDKYKNGNLKESIEGLKKVVNEKDPTYSPLSLYFIIDNNLIVELEEVNKLFDVLIDKTSLEKVLSLLENKESIINPYYQRFKTHEFDFEQKKVLSSTVINLKFSKYGLVELKKKSLCKKKL